MRIIRDALALGLAGGIIGVHIYMFMSPKKQRELEKGLRKTVREMKEISQEMLRAVKSIG